MQIKNWQNGIVALLLLGVVGFFIIPKLQPLKVDEPKSQNKSKESKGVPVYATVVEPQELSNSLTLTGTVSPSQEVDLKTEASGKITQLPLEEGAKVKKGQLLMKINASELEAQLKQKQNREELLKQKLTRKERLLENEGISQESYDETKTELESIQAEVDLIQARIEKRAIRAPFDGTLGLRHVSMGSYVSPSTKVISLINKQPVKIDFSVPGEYAKYIENGEPIKFSVNGVDSNLTAKIFAIEPAINVDTRTMQVRAIYPNPQGKVVPGTFANIKLNLSTLNDALMVPSMAIVPELQGKKVFLYQSGKSKPQPVETGQRTNTQVQVKEGLSKGDTVITKGIQKLRPGATVYIKAWE